MSVPASGPLVRLRGVGKRFPRTAHSGDRLRSLFALLRGAQDRNAIEVLRSVDLDVERGQSVALIGGKRRRQVDAAQDTDRGDGAQQRLRPSYRQRWRAVGNLEQDFSLTVRVAKTSS